MQTDKPAKGTRKTAPELPAELLDLDPKMLDALAKEAKRSPETGGAPAVVTGFRDGDARRCRPCFPDSARPWPAHAGRSFAAASSLPRSVLAP